MSAHFKIKSDLETNESFHDASNGVDMYTCMCGVERGRPGCPRMRCGWRYVNERMAGKVNLESAGRVIGAGRVKQYVFEGDL